MRAHEHFGTLGWRHELWQYVRLYNSILRRKPQREDFLRTGRFGPHAVEKDNLDLLRAYISYRDDALEKVVELLRTEEEANEFCVKHGIPVGVTATQSRDHHQSTKPMVAATSHIARQVAPDYGLDVDVNPQLSCVWTDYDKLSVTARNLDGAIPGIDNPRIVWEIKEYWGKTRGGSKMSDAVYECMLVGMDLRIMEEQSNDRITHVCLIDGKEQWAHRQSDVRRFLDILNQGLLDALIVGREVESEWEPFLRNTLAAITDL